MKHKNPIEFDKRNVMKRLTCCMIQCLVKMDKIFRFLKFGVNFWCDHLVYIIKIGSGSLKKNKAIKTHFGEIFNFKRIKTK